LPAEDEEAEEPAEPAESSAEDADDPTDADGTSGEQSEEPVEHAADDEPAEEHGLEIVEVPDDTSVPDTEDEESPEDATVHMSELESADISTDMFNKTGTLPSGEESTQMLDTERMPAITTHRSHQMLAAAAHRDVGRVRQNNQDSVLSLLTYLPREGTDMPLGLFVVADGMGGHAGGEIASRLAIRTIAHHVFAQLVLPVLDDGMIEALQPMMIAAVQEANHVIWEHAQNAGSDMGTTCTAALLLGRAFYIAHVGDSRAYLMQPGGLKVLTSDHSTVGRLIELGQLDPSAAHNHPLRNQLYRTIGQQSHVEVDFTYQPIENSTHLLLCSDGLWGMVSDDHIEQALKRSPWPQDICDELIAMANLAGGEDNISAVVVTLPVMERLRS
jgi:serine/threonine protein phosphatase PrpC